MRISCLSFALLAAIAIPVAAHADTDSFNITNGVDTLTFTLPTSPVVDPSLVYSGGFYVNDVSVVFDGSSTTDDIGFFTDVDGGGFSDDLVGDPYSDALFTGDPSTPTFQPGSYTFYDEEGGSPSGTVTITADAPEPESLVLLGTGVLGIAGALRRRRCA